MGQVWFKQSIWSTWVTRMTWGAVMAVGCTSPLVSFAQVPKPKAPKPPTLPTAPIAAPALPQVPTGKDLIIQVDGLRSADGNVCVSLFPSAGAADFPAKPDKAIASKCAKINSALSMQVVLSGVEPGTYALSLLHDANMDGIPNRTNGIPSEGFGFSQNPPLNIEPPKFTETAFEVTSPRTTIRVKLNYLQ